MVCGFLTGRRKKKPEIIGTFIVECTEGREKGIQRLFMGTMEQIPKGWKYINEGCLKSQDHLHLPDDMWICVNCGENVAPKEIRDSMSRAYSRWYY